MSQKPPPPDECANCGATIPRNASACPECGADERTGWRETDDTRYDGLDLPYSAYEDEPAPRPQRRGLAWYWYVVGFVLLASLILSVVRFR